MDRFSSCYFCGTALDDSLSEHELLPDDLTPPDDSGPSVTLCGTCSRKLEAVLEEVLGAVDAGGGGATAGSGVSEPAGSTGGDPDVSIDADVEEFFEYPGSAAGDDAGPESGSAEPASGAGEASTDDPSQAADDRSQSERDRSREAGDRGGTSGGGATGGDAAGDHPGTDEPEGEGARKTVSALENSKVMRMLENREFPVEREAFETIAANAYGVRPADVGKVIDMAIDRGLLAETDGELVKP
jgi:hypothetical protein